MKYFRILTLLFCSVLALNSCKDDKTETTNTTETNDPVRQPLPIFDAPTQQNTTAQAAGSAYHYTCSQGCAGGSAAAGNCSTCGNPLAHNQAYHNNTNNTPTTTTPTNPNTTPPTPEPSQNTAGVWHYTCSQGCAGGAGSASNCANCGTKLAHNSAYHQ